MIDRVHFENFKSLKNVTLELGRLTVLVGPNGGGKSSVLHGIELLSQTGIEVPEEASQRLRRFHWIYRGPTEPRRLANSADSPQLELSMLASDGDELQLRIQLPPQPQAKPENEPRRFIVTVTGPSGSIEVTVPGKVGRDEALDVLYDARVQRFGSVAHLHLDANQMTQTSSTDEEEPRVGSDGSGLASALAWMAGAEPDTLALIAADLAKAVPGVRRILTYRERITERVMDRINVDGQPLWRPVERARMGDRFAIEFNVGGAVPADLLSEGTVLALGLLTKLREKGRPKLVLLDDIDRGLHIEAQARLVDVLRDLLELDPELQIVCTTHSPYLLDRFEASEVRVLGLDERRHTHAHVLKDHPEFDRYRYGVQTGELWAALGEAWVTTGEP